MTPAAFAASDPCRPRYHFTAPSGWLNDPNGLIQVNGTWHLFYQHNPSRPQWGQIHWGHASSADLVNWQDEPLALAPTPGTPDEDGCFSGTCAVVNGQANLFYTGQAAGRQTQCRASSTDLLTWQKDPTNPVIGTPPSGVRATDFRDPYVFRSGDRWYLAVGGSLDHDRGAVLLYRSSGGRHWEERGVLYAATRTDQGRMWECPSLFRLDGRWVLTVSVVPGAGAISFVGDLVEERFVPTWEGVLDPDGGSFAHLAATGADGRVLQWAWLPEQRSQALIDRGTWAGALSVPRKLSLLDGALGIWPAAEVEQYRGEALLDANVPLGPAPQTFQGRHLDLHLMTVSGLERAVSVSLLRSPNGQEETTVRYDPEARQLRVDRRRSSLEPEVNLESQRVHLALSRTEGLDLRLLLDGSVLEVYANGRVCLSSRVYPARPDSLLGSVTADGPVQARLRVWPMVRGVRSTDAPDDLE